MVEPRFLAPVSEPKLSALALRATARRQHASQAAAQAVYETLRESSLTFRHCLECA